MVGVFADEGVALGDPPGEHFDVPGACQQLWTDRRPRFRGPHPAKAGRVTIAGHASDDLAPGALNSILKQAGLKG